MKNIMILMDPYKIYIWDCSNHNLLFVGEENISSK